MLGGCYFVVRVLQINYFAFYFMLDTNIFSSKWKNEKE